MKKEVSDLFSSLHEVQRQIREAQCLCLCENGHADSVEVRRVKQYTVVMKPPELNNVHYSAYMLCNQCGAEWNKEVVTKSLIS